MKESTIQDAFARVLTDRGIYFIRPRMDCRSTILVGHPDFTIFPPGGVRLVEVKAPGGKVRPEQTACHAQLAAAGYPVAIATSIEECVAALGSETVHSPLPKAGELVIFGAGLYLNFEGAMKPVRALRAGDERQFRKIA